MGALYTIKPTYEYVHRPALLYSRIIKDSLVQRKLSAKLTERLTIPLHSGGLGEMKNAHHALHRTVHRDAPLKPVTKWRLI